MMKTKLSMPKAMYLHVPFCKSICYYCDFVHQIYREDMVDRWLKALAYEIEHRNISKELDTIYIGGGTPSSLNEEQLNCLFEIIHPYTQGVQEFTVEINPETINEEKVQILKKHGVNRVSIGYQACQENILKSMNRHHTYEDVERCIRLFHQYNIKNISLDLMYSLPNTSLKDVQESLWNALKLHPTHLSLYSLIIEENSVFGKKGIMPCDEDLEADMYDWIYDELLSNGFHQYEISNFACAEQFESMHNKVYWNYDDFYGVSIGASGKDGFIRYDNTRSMKEYLEDPLKTNKILLTKEDAMFEMLMMGLRLKKGMDLKKFKDRFQISFDQVYLLQKQLCIDEGLLLEENGRLYCTDRGYHILNNVLERFLPE